MEEHEQVRKKLDEDAVLEGANEALAVCIIIIIVVINVTFH
jgi:hypothetical protein